MAPRLPKSLRWLVAAFGLACASAVSFAEDLTETGLCICCQGTPPSCFQALGEMNPGNALEQAIAQWRQENSANFARTRDAISSQATGDSCPGGPNCESMRAAAKIEGAWERGALSKHQVAIMKAADAFSAQMVDTERNAVAAEAEVDLLRASIAPQRNVPGVCSSAQAMDGIGRGSVTQAQHGSTLMQGHFAAVRNKLAPLNPREVLAMPETKTTPVMVGGHAGSMSTEQLRDAYDYLTLVMPDEPTSKKVLPRAVTDSTESAGFEYANLRYTGYTGLMKKHAMRDLVLGSAVSRVTDDQRRVWEHVSGNIAPPLLSVDGLVSLLPDFVAGLLPVRASDGSGDEFISERDYMRTEVYRRYGNRHYHDDQEYGLNSKKTEEDLYREMILMASVRNRMTLEIMNSAVDLGAILAAERRQRMAANDDGRLEAIFIEASLR